MYSRFSSKLIGLSFLCIFLLNTTSVSAQAKDGSGWTSTSLIITVAILFLSVIGILTNNFISSEEQRLGKKAVIPSFFALLKSFFQKPMPSYVGSTPAVTLDKGFDIKLKGKAKQQLQEADITRYALQPTNFVGISPIPKVMVSVGDEVRAGDPIFFDKERPEIKYVAPVSGEFIELNRAAKRAIAEIVILADKEQRYRELPALDLAESSREEIVKYFLDSGLWPLLTQRPYDIVPDPQVVPSNIFVSTFDTAPLAPDNEFILKGQEAAFQKGLDVLALMTSGKVHLGLNANGASSSAFAQFDGVEKTYFRGAHPAGNVGIQMHHIAPVSNQKIAWTVGVQDVIAIGNTILHQRYSADRIIVLAGAAVSNPSYFKTKQGASLQELLKGQPIDHQRIIDGDVLSGKEKSASSYANFHADQITLLAEGDYYEMLGWLVPSKSKPSTSKTYPNFLFKDLQFDGDTNTHGERRAFVVSGQYEKMLPMDIYPQHLMKAIVTRDLEKIEGLGIYELSEEDVALCEFACTSKQPLQQILREGLELMREQG